MKCYIGRFGETNANLGVAFFGFPRAGATPEQIGELLFPAGTRKQEAPISESLARARLREARPKVLLLKKNISGNFVKKGRALRKWQSKLCETVWCFRNLKIRKPREAQRDFFAHFRECFRSVGFRSLGQQLFGRAASQF